VFFKVVVLQFFPAIGVLRSSFPGYAFADFVLVTKKVDISLSGLKTHKNKDRDKIKMAGITVGMTTVIEKNKEKAGR